MVNEKIYLSIERLKESYVFFVWYLVEKKILFEKWKLFN